MVYILIHLLQRLAATGSVLQVVCVCACVCVRARVCVCVCPRPHTCCICGSDVLLEAWVGNL